MGDYADDVLEGVYCQYCGEYLDEDVGYPRTCHACIEDGIDVPPENNEIDLDKP